MNNYFRITGYCPKNDFCFILDSNGKFEKLWQFSSFLIQNGFEIVDVSNEDGFINVNINRAEEDKENVILRANANGKPEFIDQTVDGNTYKAIKVANKIYISKKMN